MNPHGIGLEVFGQTDIGRTREVNEDAFVVADLSAPRPVHAMRRPAEWQVKEPGVLLVVSDGMTGAQAGAVGRELALESLQRWTRAGAASAAESRLAESVASAARRVWDVASGSERTGTGPALVSVFIDGPYAYVAELGDCRAYALRGGYPSLSARDHGHARRMLDAKSTSHERATALPHGSVVVQALGSKRDASVAMGRWALLRGDLLLLCSDALTNEVSDEELGSLMTSTPILDVACARLIDLANSRGGEDNVTVMLARASGDGLPVISSEEREWLETVQAFTDELTGPPGTWTAAR